MSKYDILNNMQPAAANDADGYKVNDVADIPKALLVTGVTAEGNRKIDAERPFNARKRIELLGNTSLANMPDTMIAATISLMRQQEEALKAANNDTAVALDHGMQPAVNDSPVRTVQVRRPGANGMAPS